MGDGQRGRKKERKQQNGMKLRTERERERDTGGGMWWIRKDKRQERREKIYGREKSENVVETETMSHKSRMPCDLYFLKGWGKGTRV